MLYCSTIWSILFSIQHIKKDKKKPYVIFKTKLFLFYKSDFNSFVILTRFLKHRKSDLSLERLLVFPASILPMVVNKSSLNYCSSSDKSKRRTKTVKKSLEPKWNQTFMYSPVHRREFRERMLEITLWDQARVREEESEFLGEVQTCNSVSRQAVNFHNIAG